MSTYRQFVTDSVRLTDGVLVALSLVQPLHIIAIQSLAPLDTRKFAVEKLRSIGVLTGVRIAVLLANDIARRLKEQPFEGG